MMFRIVPRISAKLLLTPRRRAPVSFLWGLGLGAVAGIAIASKLAQGFARRRHAASEATDMTDGAMPDEEPAAPTVTTQ